MPSFWLLLLLLLYFVCSGLSSNGFVDDTLGDSLNNTQVAYFPPGAWFSSRSPCLLGSSQCPPNLDAALTSNETWHGSVVQSNDTTRELPRAEVIFSGFAVSVHCVISFSNVPRAYQTSMSFYIDGEDAGDFNVATNGGNGIVYKALVYANNTLPSGSHNLTIVNGRNDGQWYLMVLDSIEYTTNSPDTAAPATSDSGTTSSKTKVLTGALIAICLLFGIALAYLIYRICTTRARRPKALSNDDIEILPTTTEQASHSPVQGWIARYFSFNVTKPSLSFNPALLMVGRPRLRSESTKDSSGQRQSQAIFEDEVDTNSKKPVSEGRWAFITSWRDRAIREAEIPSLPPTSHAPTTVISGPALVRPDGHTTQPQRNQLQQPQTPGAQRTARRGFTVMNT